jgi:cytochrome c peroxidase
MLIQGKGGESMQQTMRRALFIVIVISLFAVPSEVLSEDKFGEIVNLPLQILPPIIPDDNPITKEKVALGKNLYFDKRLSADNTISCATCHDPKFGFADGKALAEGIKGKKGARNSPTTLNAGFYDFQFWDGRAETLEDQAKQPLINPVEMGMKDHDELVKKLRGIKEYSELFKNVFGTEEFTIDHIVQAIASFERTLVTFNSPFDRFIAGDKNAISESAKRGWKLFNEKARCNNCHGFVESYPFFTDNKFHNIGVGAKNIGNTGFEELAKKAETEKDIARLAHEKGASELGRFLVTRERKDIGAFKTPGLREIALTAPYMHDGSETTLEAVIDFYNKGGEQNRFLDGGIRPLDLTKEETKDIVEFLKTLTSDDIVRLQKKFAHDM